MKRFLFFVCIAVVPAVSFAQTITKISGFAPQYVGKQIDVFQIVDYISMKQERIASTTVGEDSTFTFSFYLKETQKLILASNNNKGFLYANPGARYDVFFPDRNKYDPYRPLGNNVELTFFGLDSTDINYKILEFNRWTDEFVATYYTKNNAESEFYVKRLDTFKIVLQNYYLKDTADVYFAYHRKFVLAQMDNMRFIGSRNQYEKYDFYLKTTAVNYQNESYMEYVKHYYEKFLQHVSLEINNKIYLGVLKSSPTLVNRAMATEYTLKHNNKLREIVMIKTLSEAFYEKDFPQTNILAILDSVSKFAFFPENRIIAKNVVLRLTELSQGSKAPDFLFSENGKTTDLKSFRGKHLYVFFVTGSSLETKKQLDLLVPIYERYKENIHFLMVVKDEGKQTKDNLSAFCNAYPWKNTTVGENDPILTNYQVVTTPYYVLIDPVGYVVGAPALTPLPNGSYDTIDKTFYLIKKALDEGTGDGR